jgi:hypothetical protein
VEQLSRFHTSLRLPFTLLSDPMLLSGELLDIPISSKKGYFSALGLHPVLRKLPRKAYLQPAFHIWRGSALVHEWRQEEKLRNLYGANGRPSPEQMLQLARQIMEDGTPTTDA